MVRRKVIATILCLLAASCTSRSKNFHGPFGEAEWKRSATPLRPGVPDKSPFWNAYAKRFIYAPAFDFKPVADAAKYKFEVVSGKDSKTRSFESNVPYAPLTPIWE